MSATKALKAEAREKAGKGAARALRREGKIPAVIYGGKKAPVGISLDRRELTLLLHAGGFKTTVFEIDTGSGKERAIPRDYQRDPVKDTLLHIDFFRVSASSVVDVEVPVHFLNEDDCPGIKKRGGVLNVVLHAVHVKAGVNDIPSAIEVDLKGLQIGDIIHANSVKLPKGVTFAADDLDELTIATIAAPTVVAEEIAEEQAEAAAENRGETAEPEEGAEGEAADTDAEDADAKQDEDKKSESRKSQDD
ncbi:50S ribosomal protein L25/general stress protein Ctc [Hansschlegelia plantiphila]|uniref:Large ribosomal subunit protein bL25 n=1 Tax=Hansschlegelia plantiphila TaxID=374655 RepID=A0A9W6IZA3_9HYPH|nr:50S ribosomal protein L25/general stress protein Ctc [Hansschlegelia plantiphila]GLK67787.1 50S ribosomal protein L25 [Hansschlegelia plantiphila]